MNYEIITLKEKIVAGIGDRTNNMSPDMSRIIGGLWNRFYGEGIYMEIPHKTSEKALGIYTDYAGDEKDDYTVMAAYEVNERPENTEHLMVKTIPAGRYARFVVTGNMQKAVAEFWEELWKMDLPRAFTCDFEEYQNGDMEHCEIHIYIGLREIE